MLNPLHWISGSPQLRSRTPATPRQRIGSEAIRTVGSLGALPGEQYEGTQDRERQEHPPPAQIHVVEAAHGHRYSRQDQSNGRDNAKETGTGDPVDEIREDSDKEREQRPVPIRGSR